MGIYPYILQAKSKGQQIRPTNIDIPYTCVLYELIYKLIQKKTNKVTLYENNWFFDVAHCLFGFFFLLCIFQVYIHKSFHKEEDGEREREI